MKNQKIVKMSEQKLTFLNYSKNTIKVYCYFIKEFIYDINRQNKRVVHLNSRDFQHYIGTYKFTSVSQQNQVISSIKFLY